MSSSTAHNSDEITTTAAAFLNDSTEDIALAAAKQLTLQIDNLSIENEESLIPSATESTINAKNITSCAACGKEGEEDSMNICNKCKMAHYCNAACKKKHKSKHKKKCERRVAELHDEELFKDPPPREECPICMLALPIDRGQSNYQVCCGKTICNGCIHAMITEELRRGKKNDELGMCAFCRSPHFSSEEEGIERLAKLVENGNAMAFYVLAGCYADGIRGVPQDRAKANELWLKAGERGCAGGYYNLGLSYYQGQGVDRDEEKAKHYYEVAAIGGNAKARHILGLLEGKAGNHERAMKHFMVAARAGDNKPLDKVKQGFRSGHVTKDEYAGTLRTYHESQTELKSEARDKAAAVFEEYRAQH